MSLKIGQRVRHNYLVGHGLGTITAIVGSPDDRLAYVVLWDETPGEYRYTNNEHNQEIVVVKEPS